MKIRLCGPLLCGGLLVLAAATNSFAQSGRYNTVQGNYIGTSRGIFVSPADTNGDGRRRSRGVQGNTTPAGTTLLSNDFGVGYARGPAKGRARDRVNCGAGRDTINCGGGRDSVHVDKARLKGNRSNGMGRGIVIPTDSHDSSRTFF